MRSGFADVDDSSAPTIVRGSRQTIFLRLLWQEVCLSDELDCVCHRWHVAVRCLNCPTGSIDSYISCAQELRLTSNTTHIDHVVHRAYTPSEWCETRFEAQLPRASERDCGCCVRRPDERHAQRMANCSIAKQIVLNSTLSPQKEVSRSLTRRPCMDTSSL